jgi:aminoglycoside phosphotransferase (APT) family kinase protein
MSKNKIQVVKETLVAEFPNLDVKTVKVLATGWHQDAVEVNGSVIFRIPHHAHGQAITPEAVQHEVKLLKFLTDKVPVKIPDPQYVAADESYFGYTKLEGAILHDILEKFTQNDWERLKADWVAISSALHQNVSLEAARSLKVPDYKPLSLNTAKGIFDIPKVEADVLNFARTIIKRYEGYNSAPRSYVFIHSDLHSRNLLADPETKRITGIIDWTDACVGPLPREFSIHDWMQDNLLNEATHLYEEKTGVHIDANQARMWYSLDELTSYVEQIKAGKADEAAESLRRLKHLISTER